MKLAVVTPQPTPYRDPFWNELAGRPGIELDVFYCANGGAERPWSRHWDIRFRAETLPGICLGPAGMSYLNPGILARLRQSACQALILGGYNHLTMLLAMCFARRRHIPYFLMSEVYLAQPRPAWRKIVKRPLVASVVRHAAGGFPTGALAADYLVHYGASPDKLARVPNAPDVAAIHRQAPDLAARRDRLRESRALPPGPVILFAGRLIPLKQVDTLMVACQTVFQRRPGTLLIVGDGPMRRPWEQLAWKLGLADRVRFVGFVEPETLPEWYAVSDLFALPSSDETWGVVVLEALASGLPVVVTDLVGCHPDVINHPDVGSVVKVGDAPGLAQAILRHLERPVSRSDIARLWAPVRETMSYPAIADRMVGLLKRTVPG